MVLGTPYLNKRRFTWSLFILKASHWVVQRPISMWCFKWWRPFIDWLKFKTCQPILKHLHFRTLEVSITIFAQNNINENMFWALWSTFSFSLLHWASSSSVISMKSGSSSLPAIALCTLEVTKGRLLCECCMASRSSDSALIISRSFNLGCSSSKGMRSHLDLILFTEKLYWKLKYAVKVQHSKTGGTTFLYKL